MGKLAQNDTLQKIADAINNNTNTNKTFQNANADLSSRITTLEGTATTLKTKIDLISGTIDSLKTGVNNSQNVLSNAAYKNSVYSGKYLGGGVSAAQYAEIKALTFNGIGLGDYWTINGINWRIWHFNPGYGQGDTNFSSGALYILPDTCLLSADGSTTHYWNNTNTTAGGYAGSKYRSTYRAQCRTKVEAAFGAAHIGKHRELISNAISGDKASGWAWTDCDVELPSEAMMYGTTVWGGSTINGSGYNVGTGWFQLALAQVAPWLVFNRGYNYWLRDIVSSTSAAYVYYFGYANSYSTAAAWIGVRPGFYLVG